MKFSPLLLALAFLPLTVLAAPPGVTYSGTTATQNFGTVSVATASSPVSLSFSVGSGAIVGSIELVTQGAPNLDFTNAGTGTCTDKTYSSTTSCTVEVIFKPVYAGLRRGAVLFWSGAGNTGSIIGKTLVYGAGNGGQIAYGPGTWTTIANPTNLSPNSFNDPPSTTVDGSGNLYDVDGSNNRPIEYPAAGGAAISIDPSVQDALTPGEYSTFSYPNKAVVDGAGDVWIADAAEARVVELPVGGGTPLGVQGIINGIQFNYVEGLDVDGLGNL